MGVLFTIYLQRKELGLTRIELDRSASALEAQNEYLKRQNFESSFFRMLELHNLITNSIDLVTKDGRITRGRDCFVVFKNRFDSFYNRKTDMSAGDIDRIRHAYVLFWNQHRSELGHYYRYLYNVVRFLKESDYSKEYYVKILRAQLSDQELVVIFYNCLSLHGAKFKRLAEEFALFDNLPLNLLLDPIHKDLMLPSAFGEPE